MRADSKRVLVRIAVSGGAVVPDWDAKLPGRGGYLHLRRECLARFVRSKVKLFRSLQRTVDLAERRAVAKLVGSRLES